HLWAHVPELGQGSAKHRAALVGVAPLNRDSGAWRDTRAIWGVRRQVRAALSMAALVAARHHLVIRAGSTALLARGKPKKVALTACRHNLLTIPARHRAGPRPLAVRVYRLTVKTVAPS